MHGDHIQTLRRVTLAVLASCVMAALPSSPARADSTIQIRDLAFGPMNVQISAGETVIWANVEEAMPHNVANGASGGNSNGDLFSSPFLMPGDSFSFTFTDPGEFTYYCPLHPAMAGIVIVSPS
jgi:plastocyanin